MIRICVTNKQKLTRKKESENKIQSMKVACDRSLTWLGTTLRTCTSPLTSSPVLLCRRWSSSLQRRIAQNLLRSRGSFFSFALLILFLLSLSCLVGDCWIDVGLQASHRVEGTVGPASHQPLAHVSASAAPDYAVRPAPSIRPGGCSQVSSRVTRRIKCERL